MRVFLSVCALLLLGLGGLAFDFYFWATRPLPVDHQRIVELQPGTSFSKFSNLLQDEGVIARPLYLRVLAELRGGTARLQAGEYAIQISDTPSLLLQKLMSGDTMTHAVRVDEGITVAALLDRLGAEPLLFQDLGDRATLASRLGIDSPSLEGWFLPETYSVKRGDSALALLRRAHAAMQERLRQAWTQRCDGVALSSPYELLILASLVEKETGVPEDRGFVSQVFHLRLQRNMRLQTDPTVIYALGENFDGNLRKVDLSVDSAYNTYLYRGLPPTPIALASVAALDAAACPAHTDFLYFVARGDGSSQFSRTLAEHNAAVRRFQLGQND